MLFLGIESSCDETSLALLEGEMSAKGDFVSFVNSFRVESHLVSSQVGVHRQFGGVVPEIGARQHAEAIHGLFIELLEGLLLKRGLKSQSDPSLQELTLEHRQLLSELGGVYVTVEPGLVSALRVGMEFAQTIKFFLAQTGLSVPIMPVNHLRGHVASGFVLAEGGDFSDREVFPHLHLLVSGGNSQLILLKSWRDWQIVGQTMDDAAGECLDKVGRMLGLPYPGGVSVAKIAGMQQENFMGLPKGMQNNVLAYSFSGLKTAVRYLVQRQNIPNWQFEQALSVQEIEALKSGEFDSTDPKLGFIHRTCVSAQYLVMEQLTRKMRLGVAKYAPKSLGLSGGVSANLLLRNQLSLLAESMSIPLFIPPMYLTGDNAVMITLAGLADLYEVSEVDNKMACQEKKPGV